MLNIENNTQLQQWAVELLNRISVVANLKGLPTDLLDASQELRDAIIGQATAKFVYESDVSGSDSVDISHVAEASLRMEQLIYEAKLLVSELEQEAKKFAL